MDRLAVGRNIGREWVGTYLVMLGVWYPISVPFMTLLVIEIRGNRPFPMAIAVIPLLIVVWVLRLHSNMEEKNARQEFLRQLAKFESESEKTQPFLMDLLKGLREFVQWDRELLVLRHANEVAKITLGKLPPDSNAVEEKLLGMLEDADFLAKPLTSRGRDFTPLLGPYARSQLVIALATARMAFGVLVVERTVPEAFRNDEVQ